MAPLETGMYHIINVKQNTKAVLLDANNDTPIVSGLNEEGNVARWNVSDLVNGQYEIKNKAQSNYAYSGGRPSLESVVVGRDIPQRWIIKETSTQNQYTISPSDSGHLFWSFANAETDTHVELSDKANDKRTWWMFVKP